MNRSYRFSANDRARSLHMEQLEKRLPLSVNVSGEIFWDANRNGMDDDSIAAPAGVTISLQGNLGAVNENILNKPLVGTQVPYSIDNILDESVDPTTGASFKVADIDTLLASGFELTSPLSSDQLSIRSYNTRSTNLPSKPSWVEAADLDGINGPDLIVANFLGSKLTIFLNDGVGIFTNRLEIDVAVNSTSIAIADFDTDGDMDIVVGNEGSTFFDLLINDGTGTFSAPGSVVPIQSGDGPSSIVTADVNNDGKMDLVVSNFWDHTVSVYLNTSSGGQLQFDTTGIIDDIDVTSGNTMIAVANLGGQPGSLSLLVLDIALDKILIFDNDGQGNFSFSQDTIDIEGSRFMTAGRIDDDSYDDLAVHDPTKREVRVYFGNAQGGFDAQFADPMTVWFPRGIALADMDGDGDNDLVANLIDERPPTVLRNDGNRQITDAQPIENVPLDAVVTSPPAMADFNGDGVIDIAYSPKWQGGKIIVSLRQLNDGQHVVRTVNQNGLSHSLSGRDFGVSRVVSSASTLAGDYDGDGTVDNLDLEVWKANHSRTAGPGMSADSNGSNRVDGADFLTWQRNFGNVVAPVQALAETAAATVATEDFGLEEAVAVDANIAWLASASAAFSAAVPLRTGLTETQLKDEVFYAEAVSDSQLRLLSPKDSDIESIHTPSRSQETFPRRAARYPVDALLSDLDQQELVEGY